MKIYISADIEGVAGVTHVNETSPDKPIYSAAQKQMTAEVLAACEGAINVGAKEIIIKDAHAHGLNILMEKLPSQAKILRGWSGHPYSMMEGIDKSFDAVLFIGYHSEAGGSGNPLAHTISGSTVYQMKINDISMSEFLINSFTASYLGVPIAFLSGDENLCQNVKQYNESIVTVSTGFGIGGASLASSPQKIIEKINKGVEKALIDLSQNEVVPLPNQFKVQINYHKHKDAYQKSFYPGMKMTGNRQLEFESDDYYEVLRMLNFVL